MRGSATLRWGGNCCNLQQAIMAERASANRRVPSLVQIGRIPGVGASQSILESVRRRRMNAPKSDLIYARARWRDRNKQTNKCAGRASEKLPVCVCDLLFPSLSEICATLCKLFSPLTKLRLCARTTVISGQFGQRRVCRFIIEPQSSVARRAPSGYNSRREHRIVNQVS